MSYWLTDPELFLYAKGTTGPDDVHLWRCKKPASSSSSSSSSLVVPLESDDFEYVETVKNHLELIGELFYWDETDYKRLVRYIYEKRLLVNGQGFVIAELHKADKDGNKTIDDANEEDVPAAIYIRSLDVLPLKPYIPNLRERPIPWRTVKYLGDVNGKAALIEEKEDSNVTKLTARVDDLEGKITKLTADLVTQMNELTAAWMNDLTNSEWVDFYGLTKPGIHEDFTIVGPLGTFTTDDYTTNVRARYCYKVKLTGNAGDYKVVSLQDLTPNKQWARFTKEWFLCTSKRRLYVFRSI